ncbi:hypothetical protein JCM10213_007177 [Rhodosporidiobolus nylandii]
MSVQDSSTLEASARLLRAAGLLLYLLDPKDGGRAKALAVVADELQTVLDATDLKLPEAARPPLFAAITSLFSAEPTISYMACLSAHTSLANALQLVAAAGAKKKGRVPKAVVAAEERKATEEAARKKAEEERDLAPEERELQPFPRAFPPETLVIILSFLAPVPRDLAAWCRVSRFCLATVQRRLYDRVELELRQYAPTKKRRYNVLLGRGAQLHETLLYDQRPALFVRHLVLKTKPIAGTLSYAIAHPDNEYGSHHEAEDEDWDEMLKEEEQRAAGRDINLGEMLAALLPKLPNLVGLHVLDPTLALPYPSPLSSVSYPKIVELEVPALEAPLIRTFPSVTRLAIGTLSELLVLPSRITLTDLTLTGSSAYEPSSTFLALTCTSLATLVRLNIPFTPFQAAFAPPLDTFAALRDLTLRISAPFHIGPTPVVPVFPPHLVRLTLKVDEVRDLLGDEVEIGASFFETLPPSLEVLVLDKRIFSPSIILDLLEDEGRLPNLKRLEFRHESRRKFTKILCDWWEKEDLKRLKGAMRTRRVYGILPKVV